jgi:hypothetical protein
VAEGLTERNSLGCETFISPFKKLGRR